MMSTEMQLQFHWVMRNHIKPGKHTSENTSKADYTKLFQVIGKIRTVKEMWQILNNIPFPHIIVNTNKSVRIGNTPSATIGLSVFQHQFEPTWEIFQEKEDGTCEMFISCHVEQVIAELWTNLLLDMLGNSIENIDLMHLAGVRIIHKNTDLKIKSTTFKIELWILNMTIVRDSVKRWLMRLCKQSNILAAAKFKRDASHSTHSAVQFISHAEKMKFGAK
jgi:hypothetical protein